MSRPDTIFSTTNRNIKTMNIESHPKIGLGNVFPAGEVKFITLTSDSEGTAVYINGKREKYFSGYSLITKSHLNNAQLILGNSPTGKYSWNGNIFGMAIYSRSLRDDEVYQRYQAWLKHIPSSLSKNEGPVQLYLFDEHDGTLVHNHTRQEYDLFVPATFHVLQKTILTLPWKQFRLTWSYFTDVFINIVGFIPFGFFFYAFLNNVKQISRCRAYIITILLGGGISLAIELFQVYLPTRSSSLTDLISNILGTILGVIIFHRGLMFLGYHRQVK